METKRVVIVDDSKFIVKQLVQFYRDEMGFEIVATGESGEEALELYRLHRPDLLSLDIVMGGISGLDVVEQLIPEFPDARIMMVSAVRTYEMLECINSGAKGYVEKPLQLHDTDYVKDFKDTLAEIFSE